MGCESNHLGPEAWPEQPVSFHTAFLPAIMSGFGQAPPPEGRGQKDDPDSHNSCHLSGPFEGALSSVLPGAADDFYKDKAAQKKHGSCLGGEKFEFIFSNSQFRPTSYG